MNTHERHEPLHPLKTSSDRSFGLIFACLFLIIGVYMVIGSRSTAYLWFLLAGALSFVAAVYAPGILAPLNTLWTRFGLLLHMIVSPIALGSIFFLVVMPIGLAMRLFRKDPLRLHFDHELTTYWIKRDPAGPDSGGFRNQF
jgi:hypothetical protein